MKILIVSGGFFPNQSPRSLRATELAKELARIGHTVTVVAQLENFNFDKFCLEHPIKLVRLQVDSVYFRLIALIQSRSSFVARLLNRILYQFFDFPSILFLKSIPRTLSRMGIHDLIISIAAPHAVHWGVNKSIRKNPDLTKMWIADCGDPYMFATLESFKRPFYFSYLERSFCKKCNFISVPFEGARNAYYPDFSEKIRVIPQGFSFDNVRIAPSLRSNDKPTFAYAGGLALKGVRNPTMLLDWLATLRMDFEFHIYSPNLEVIPNHLLGLMAGRIVLHKSIPREKLLFELSSFHFLVNFDNDSAFQLPSKLIDYALTGRPIISINSNTLDVKLFLDFMNGNYSMAYEVKQLKNYNITNVAESFLKLASERR